MENNYKRIFMAVLAAAIVASSVLGAAFGFLAGSLSQGQLDLKKLFNLPGGAGTVKTINEESAVVAAVDKVSPAVVSIIITKNLPNIQQYNNRYNSDFFRQFFGQDFSDFFGTDTAPDSRSGSDKGNGTIKREIGGGSGFIITADGFIVTNRHVIIDPAADYTVLMNDGKKYAAKVLAQDSIIDLAVLKISANNLPTVELGDSTNLRVGQTVIAIGNALGEFRNTVSTGVISGLARSVTAGGTFSGSEQLVNVIQTDASINPGNSGGPLLNIAGQVIGINTAIAQGAQNIGFAIPISEAKNTIESIRKYGRIIRPWLGVRYTIINQALADANQLPVNYGALIVRGRSQTDLAIIPGSPADKAGLKENDIILEVNGQKITEDNALAGLIAKFKPGDDLTLKIMHQSEIKTVKVKLEEMK